MLFAGNLSPSTPQMIDLWSQVIGSFSLSLLSFQSSDLFLAGVQCSFKVKVQNVAVGLIIFFLCNKR